MADRGRPKKNGIEQPEPVEISEIENYPEKENEIEPIIETITSGIDLVDIIDSGFPWGMVVNIVGDAHTGKSLWASEFIYAVHKLLGKKLKWRYDDCEETYAFNSQMIWGIDIIDEKKENSFTLEDFESNLDQELKEIKDDEYFIYILDSLDTLTTKEEEAYHLKKLKAHEEGKEIKGSYGMSKAKGMSSFFRMQKRKIKYKKCILIIISQVRENIGATFGAQYYRTGGKALDHQAALIFWLALVERHKKGELVSGSTIRILCTKNKITGKQYRKCTVEISDHGIDNVSTNLKFLYDLKTDSGKDIEGINKALLRWDEQDYRLRHLIPFIERNNLEEELKKRVKEKWLEIEAKSDTNIGRKPKF